MDLHLPTAGLERYKSASQRARVGTESWGATNFFCPACESPRLRPSPRGTAAIDYFCPSCDSPFQLKSQSKPLGARIDVLQVVQSLGKLEFTLADVYARADALAKLHPKNAHVRPKIRQQLQVLRDLGLLDFLGGCSYRLR